MTLLGRSIPMRIAKALPASRSGFSLLELMLALGLLGALLAVAWSLLGTYRNAEIRGWKLSHRVQTVRSARAWLEWDAQHFITSSENNSNESINALASSSTPSFGTKQSVIGPTKSHRFIGNAMGFSATIAPSIDPIPFLENLMSDRTQSDRQTSTLDSLQGEEASSINLPNSPWPAETIEIEYRLTPMSLGSSQSKASPSNATQDFESDDSQYVLNRIETTDSQSRSTESDPSQRTLSAVELYRQSEESGMDSNQTYRESKLEGLTKVQFRYFDGSAWKSNWNSDQQRGLPLAIALGFDFPATSEIQLPSTASSESSDENAMDSDLLQSPESFDLDSTIATESVAELSAASSPAIMESSTSEVQIVVLVTNGSVRSTAAATPSSQRDRP